MSPISGWVSAIYAARHTQMYTLSNWAPTNSNHWHLPMNSPLNVIPSWFSSWLLTTRTHHHSSTAHTDSLTHGFNDHFPGEPQLASLILLLHLFHDRTPGNKWRRKLKLLTPAGRKSAAGAHSFWLMKEQTSIRAYIQQAEPTFHGCYMSAAQLDSLTFDLTWVFHHVKAVSK